MTVLTILAASRHLGCTWMFGMDHDTFFFFFFLLLLLLAVLRCPNSWPSLLPVFYCPRSKSKWGMIWRFKPLLNSTYRNAYMAFHLINFILFYYSFSLFSANCIWMNSCTPAELTFVLVFPLFTCICQDPLLDIDLNNSPTWAGSWSQLCPTCKVCIAFY